MKTITNQFRKMSRGEIVAELERIRTLTEDAKVLVSRPNDLFCMVVRTQTEDGVVYLNDCPNDADALVKLAPLFNSKIRRFNLKDLIEALADGPDEVRLGWRGDSQTVAAVGFVAPVIHDLDNVDVVIACVPPDIDEINAEITKRCAEHGCPFAAETRCQECRYYLGCGIVTKRESEVIKEHKEKRSKAAGAEPGDMV